MNFEIDFNLELISNPTSVGSTIDHVFISVSNGPDSPHILVIKDANPHQTYIFCLDYVPDFVAIHFHEDKFVMEQLNRISLFDLQNHETLIVQFSHYWAE